MMKFNRRTVLGAVAATAITLAPFSSATAQELVKIGTFVPEKSVGVAKVIQPWMKAVQGDIGDAVKLQGFWGGTLGKSPFKQFELVRNGVADVTWVLPGYTGGQFPEMGIFELPFLFNTAEEASTVGWKLHEEGLLTGMDGVHVLGFFTAEPNALFMKKKIGSLDDLKGMKIRSAGPIHARWLEGLGAAPQVLSSGEMNEALNRGTVDGAVQGWTGMNTFKSLQLVDQSYGVPAGAIPFLLLMNKGKWDGLPKNVQDAMMKHGGLNMAQQGGAAYTGAGDAIRVRVKGEGRINMTDVDAATMKTYSDGAKVVHDWWIEKTPNGRKVYDRAVELLAEMRG